MYNRWIVLVDVPNVLGQVEWKPGRFNWKALYKDIRSHTKRSGKIIAERAFIINQESSRHTSYIKGKLAKAGFEVVVEEKKHRDVDASIIESFYLYKNQILQNKNARINLVLVSGDHGYLDMIEGCPEKSCRLWLYSGSNNTHGPLKEAAYKFTLIEKFFIT